jgi:hypothetical protein
VCYLYFAVNVKEDDNSEKGSKEFIFLSKDNFAIEILRNTLI